MTASSLKITLVKSSIKRPHTQKSILASLSLRKINSYTIKLNSADLQGVLRKIGHLVLVEEIA